MRGFVFACLVLASAAHVIPYGSSSSSSPPTYPTPSTSTAQPPALDQPTSTSPAYESSTTAAPYGTLSTTLAADEPTTFPSSPPTTPPYAMSSSSESPTPAEDEPSTSPSSPPTTPPYAMSSSSESPTPAEDEPSSTSPATSTSSYGSYASSSVPALPQDEPSTSTTFLPTTSTFATSLPPTSTSNYNSGYEEYNSGAVAEIRSLDSPTAESSGQFPWNDGGDVCQDRADGLYVWGACSSQFLTCSGGIARIMDCPFGLVYNVPIEACDYPHAVASCNEASGAAAADQPTDAAVTAASTTTAPATTQRPLPQCQDGLAIGVPSSACTVDGLQPLSPCSSHFEMCLSGRLFSLSCGVDFVFTSAGRCESLSAVPECEALSSSTTTTTTPAFDEATSTTMNPISSSSSYATY